MECKDFEALLRCGEKCCNGGRWKQSIQAFEMCLTRNTATAKRELENKTFKPQTTNNFMIKERGKWRAIRAHPVKDRQIYKSFCQHYLREHIDNLVADCNNASQKGKGTDRSIYQFGQALARAYRKWGRDFYVITYDYHNYFGSIPQKEIAKVLNITDSDALLLLEDYINLFPEGVGIGGEPSQDIAVSYAHSIDKMLITDKRVDRSGRYMDDGYATVQNKDDARAVLNNIKEKSNSLGLVINNKRTRISHMTKDSVIWLKKRTFISDTGAIVMRLTRENVRDRLRTTKLHKKLVDNGTMPRLAADMSIECWCSYAYPYKAYHQMQRVVNDYVETFNIPWSEAKFLLHKRRSKWNKSRK